MRAWARSRWLDVCEAVGVGAYLLGGVLRDLVRR